MEIVDHDLAPKSILSTNIQKTDLKPRGYDAAFSG
jgi:hypothetical protein